MEIDCSKQKPKHRAGRGKHAWPIGRASVDSWNDGIPRYHKLFTGALT